MCNNFQTFRLDIMKNISMITLKQQRSRSPEMQGSPSLAVVKTCPDKFIPDLTECW